MHGWTHEIIKWRTKLITPATINVSWRNFSSREFEAKFLGFEDTQSRGCKLSVLLGMPTSVRHSPCMDAWVRPTWGRVWRGGAIWEVNKRIGVWISVLLPSTAFTLYSVYIYKALIGRCTQTHGNNRTCIYTAKATLGPFSYRPAQAHIRPPWRALSTYAIACTKGLWITSALSCQQYSLIAAIL